MTYESPIPPEDVTPMHQPNDQTLHPEQFERHRRQLEAVAYRMLGSVGEAEDAVQESWLRVSRSRPESIENVGGFLTTVVGRVCIDMLRARRARPEDAAGDRLPEAIVSSDENSDPEHETLLADAVGLALLVVLDTLTPAERLAFVLHDMFAVPFAEIAPIVDRTPDAARQLASRARRRVRGGAPAPDADLARQREIVAAFLAASRAGDFDALLALLDPGVVMRVDLAGRTITAPERVTGALDVAGYTAQRGPRFARLCRPALVNGAAGIVVESPTARIAAVAFTITHGLIATIDVVRERPRSGESA
jgi:RNA polymerase sigma-70 factor (ECF subfamily)